MIIGDLQANEKNRMKLLTKSAKGCKSYLAGVLKQISEKGFVNSNEKIVNLIVKSGVYLNSSVNKNSSQIRSLVKTVMSSASAYLSDETMAEVGAYVLNFVKDTDKVAYHSQNDTWQKAFGYNSFYDTVFGSATDMKNLSVKFKSGNTDYALWIWKGNYLNLNSGAEMGLYKNPVHIKKRDNELTHYRDSADPIKMTLSLYSDAGKDIKNVFNWYPCNQWWITGFSGAKDEFRNPRSVNLHVVGQLQMGNLFEDCYRIAENDTCAKDAVVKDDNILWIVW